jgi:hypothetical protein
MSDSSKCRRCGAEIFWRKSQRTGRSYPVNSPDNPRDFHKCEPPPAQQPAKNPEPLTPDYFDLEPTVEERVAALEKQVVQLTRTVQEAQGRQPITSEDVGF